MESLSIPRQSAAGRQEHDNRRFDEYGQGEHQAEGGQLRFRIRFSADDALNQGTFGCHQEPCERQGQPENQHLTIGHGFIFS